ncbi:ribosomal protein S6 kinase-related protein-like isoform X2 [Heptranchias perlo]|uniref:ribosomal protein S6 kinase-related protein-like isoform X2 n=1 Tax=Heptranchias perlo TaxID=212740 RepID=UPI00355A31BE
MGNERSAARGGNPTRRWVSISKWRSSLSSRYTLGVFQTARKSVPEQERAKSNTTGSTEWPFPRFISLFFPVFPYRSQPVDQEFQVLLKAEVVRHGILQQCKDGAVIQKQVHHPFVQSLRECWQTSRLLFIMCDYHCSGDLFVLWSACGPFDEGRVRVFAAELGSAIGFLHDFGVVHRDVKMENVLLNERGHLKLTDFGLSRRLCRGERACTICGTMQYMAPEVLGGRPYNHSADWWSLGILLYALVTGKFPVEPQRDHASMLASVRGADLNPPASLTQTLAHLLAELLCRDPQLRLHRLDAFAQHRFFQGLSFDPDLLQKQPLEFNLSGEKQLTQSKQDQSPFRGFDCELLGATRLPLAG